ncbi:MAG: biotin-dependent carboxyltransferase family protein [Leeuwenhoekiella sp.]
MAEIQIISPGLYTSIQDLGRNGVAQYGIPQAGAMDSFAARRANLLLNNDQNSAVLEITFTGPKLKFTDPALICISGAQFNVSCGDSLIYNDKPFKVNAGDEVHFKELKKGFRAYLATSGGIDFPEVMGSKSQYEEITESFRLKKGDRLNIFQGEWSATNTKSRLQNQLEHYSENFIEVVPGPEFDLLDLSEKKKIFERDFTITPSSNRMSAQLKEVFENKLGGLVTSATVPGTVQLTPRGGLIILMRDCQVSGGYPRILQLTEMGISRLAQQAPGKSIVFKMSVE